MMRSFLIRDFVPYAGYELNRQGISLTPAELAASLAKLNLKQDPVHAYEKKRDIHETPPHDHDAVITDAEFQQNRRKLSAPLRRLVAAYFAQDFHTYHAQSASGTYVVLDNGNDRCDPQDFIFNLDEPTAPQQAQDPRLLADLKGNADPAEWVHRPWIEWLEPIEEDAVFSLASTSELIAALPPNDARLDVAEKRAAQASVSRILADFENIRTLSGKDSDAGNRLQDNFLCLMMLVEKGWGASVLASLQDLDPTDWNRIFNHTRLPLMTARVFARAFVAAPTDLSRLSMDGGRPLAWRLLIAASRSHILAALPTEARSTELSRIKSTLFEALTLSSDTVHPALRLVAIEALGTLANADFLGADDIDPLMQSIRSYHSPTEDNIRELLSEGQQNPHMNLQQLKLFDFLPDAASESTRGDYETDGVITYWLMDFNHEIIEKLFAVLIAIPASREVAMSLCDFMARDRREDMPVAKNLSYVEYYKGAEALNALGQLYRRDKWISTAFNLHVNNQIGREIERNPNLVKQMMADFDVDNKTLIASWDDSDRRLARNYSALQISRWCVEDQHNINEWETLADEQKTAVMNDAFGGNSPDDLNVLQDFMAAHTAELLGIVNGSANGTATIDRMDSDTFQRWMNWQHFGPFLIDAEESMKLALSADLRRKAWSWEFAELRPEEMAERSSLYLQLLEDFKENPFAWLRLDLVTSALSSPDESIRLAALDVLKELQLPEDVAHMICENGPLATRAPHDDKTQQAIRKAIHHSTHREPERVPFPDETLRGPTEPFTFVETESTPHDMIAWTHHREHVDRPADAAPHAYRWRLRDMADGNSKQTLEEMVRLLRDPAVLEPGNHKFRYLAERKEWGAIAVDAVVTDKMLQKILTNSFLHAGKANQGMINWLLTQYLRGWTYGHQATLIELFREFHLTYPGGDPLEHLAITGHKFVRDRYIVRQLRAAIAQGEDARPEIMAYLEENENQITEYGERIHTIDKLLASDPSAANAYAQAFSGQDAKICRDTLDHQRQLALEERRLWIDNIVNLM